MGADEFGKADADTGIRNSCGFPTGSTSPSTLKLETHLLLDNDGTHEPHEVKKWLAARLCYHVEAIQDCIQPYNKNPFNRSPAPAG